MSEIIISNSTLWRITIWGAMLSLLYFFKDLILILVLGIFFAVILEPIIKKILKLNLKIKNISIGFNRGSATFFIFLIAFTFIFFFLYKLLPIIANQLINLYESLHNKILNINAANIPFAGESLKIIILDYFKYLDVSNFVNIIKSSSNSFTSIIAFISGFFGGILNFLLIIVFTFYFCLEDRGVERLIRIFSPQDYTNNLIAIWNRAENKIQNWAEGQLLSAIIMSIIVFISLFIANMPYAFTFAILSFIGQMIPLVGLILSSIPAIIVALLFVNIKFAIIIAIIFFIIAQIENYIVYPKVMDNKVGVPALFVLIAILIGVKLLGFWGVVLAVPVAAVIIETLKDMYKHKI